MSENQSGHAIEGLMKTTLESIKQMIDVNTIIGNPIQTQEGTIIPISKVTFGFLTGGSEFVKENQIPFGGASSSGINITPIGFLVIQKENIKLIPLKHIGTIDKLLDNVPDIIEKIDKYITEKQHQNYC